MQNDANAKETELDKVQGIPQSQIINACNYKRKSGKRIFLINIVMLMLRSTIYLCLFQDKKRNMQSLSVLIN